MVGVYRFGKVYHYKWCWWYINAFMHLGTVADAVAKGYGECKSCGPPCYICENAKSIRTCVECSRPFCRACEAFNEIDCRNCEN